MFDIISIGSATVDLFVKPKNDKILRLATAKDCMELLCFEYGGKLEIEEVHECFGGGAANTAVGFSRLGLNAGACALVGDDEWGDKAITNLKKEGIEANTISRTSAVKTSFSVILNSFEGDRTVLYFGGANCRLKAKHVAGALAETKWIFINRLASTEEKKILSHILTIKKSNPDIKIAWNPGGQQIKNSFKNYEDLLKNTEILILNKEEGAMFSQENYVAPETYEEISLSIPHKPRKDFKKSLPPYAFALNKIFKKFHDLGVTNTVLTDGKRGAQVYNDAAVYFCPILSQKRKDILGAGDAFSTGFTYAIMQDTPLQTALQFGTINATSVINFYGAQAGLLSKRQLQEEFEKTNLEISKINIS